MFLLFCRLFNARHAFAHYALLARTAQQVSGSEF
jgi:hypothetical protein